MINRPKLDKALEIARSALLQSEHELINYYGNIEYKEKSNTGDAARDIVTHLDSQIEEFLANKLAKLDPAIGFRGEETGVRKEADVTWLIDPIDGTGHFVRGLPFCTTMVALIDKGEVVLSVINDFVRRDMYWAIKGGGAFCNGNEIKVSNRRIGDSLVSFESKLDIPGNVDIYLNLRKSVGSIISTVNCGFEFSMIASGKIDGRIAKDPYGFDWDYAPGSLLVTEAGGIASNIGSNKYDYRIHDYIIANPTVHKALTSGKDALFSID